MRGWVAIILAFGATGAVLTLCIGAVVQDETISQQGADLLSTALGVLIGAVASYMGGGRSDTDLPRPAASGAHRAATGHSEPDPDPDGHAEPDV